MSDQSLSERRRHRTMRELQRTAFAQAAARGYSAVTVEGIAAEAEVSPRSVYRYFGTKDAIFLWDDGDAPLLEQVVSRGSTVGPLEALRQAVHASFDARFDSDPDGMRQRLRLIRGEPTLAAAARARIDGFRSALAAVLAATQARDPKELRVQVAAAAAVGALMAAIDAWAEGDGSRSFADTVDDAFAVLAGGLR